MKDLHLALFGEHFPPETGAAPARFLEMGRRWIDRGARVTVLTALPHRPEGRIHAAYRGRLGMEEEWAGMRVLRSWVFARPGSGFAATVANNLTYSAGSLFQALRRVPPVDVVVASAPPFFAHLPGVVFSRLRGVPLVLELRDLWPDYIEAMGVVRSSLALRAIFGLERRMLTAARRVVVVTDSFAARVAEKGVPEDRISVIPNGVDPTFYGADLPEAVSDGEGGSPTIGYLGNFGAGQDLTTVVEAAKMLEARGEPARFVLVGEGREKERLLETVERAGTTSVEIRPSIPKSETPAFYRECDACLVPLAAVEILQETIPSKLFEVMASRRPVIAGLGGEGRRIVEESGGGFVSPPGDPAGIARSVSELRRLTVGERREMGERGRVYVERHYHRERLADRYLDLLRSVAGVERRSKVAFGPRASLK